MAKIGERFVEEMVDKGRREIASVLYQESNIAQPLYPLRGTYGKEVTPSDGQEKSVLGEALQHVGQHRDDPGRDDPGIDRDI